MVNEKPKFCFVNIYFYYSRFIALKLKWIYVYDNKIELVNLFLGGPGYQYDVFDLDGLVDALFISPKCSMSNETFFPHASQEILLWILMNLVIGNPFMVHDFTALLEWTRNFVRLWRANLRALHSLNSQINLLFSNQGWLYKIYIIFTLIFSWKLLFLWPQKHYPFSEILKVKCLYI